MVRYIMWTKVSLWRRPLCGDDVFKSEEVSRWSKVECVSSEVLTSSRGQRRTRCCYRERLKFFDVENHSLE